MKALSIRQPWAWLIVNGFPIMEAVDNGDGSQRVEFSGKVALKSIENRTWPLPTRFPVPQRVYVHAGVRRDHDALLWLMGKGLPAGIALMLESDRIPRGAIIGEVTITDCVTESKSFWFTGPYGFVLSDPVAYETPIPCKGRLGFFEPGVEA